jgi:hypothetical protein
MMNKSKQDPKDWARKILGDYAAGVKKSPTVVKMARDALNVQ